MIVLVFTVCGSVSLLGFVLDAVYASMQAAGDLYPPSTSTRPDPTQPNMDRPNPWPCLMAGGLYPAWLETYTAVSNCLVVFNAAVNFLLIYQPPSCYRLDRPLSKSSSSLACLSTSS